MKTLLNLVIFSSAVCLVYSTASKELSSKFFAAKKACQEKFQLDLDAVDKSFKSGNEPTDDEKCMMACFFHEMNLLKDGKADLDALKEAGKQRYPGDDENKEKSEQVVTICTEKVLQNDNECDYVSSMVICFLEEAKKLNLEDAEYEDE